MALPIKDTPVLKGKDAERFYEKIESGKKASDEEKKRIKKSYEKLMKAATFK